MAIKNDTADAVFTYTNATHYAGWAFADVNSGTSFTSTWWVYLNNATPFTVWSYDGGGSYIRIEHNGTNWVLNLNGATTTISAIQVGTWASFGYVKTGNNHKVYYNSSLLVNTTVSITFAFDSFTFRAGQGNAVCSFKMFGAAVDTTWEVSYWMAQQTDYVKWTSFLRRPGDLYAQHGVYGGNNWATVNEWTTFPTWTDLTFQDDPTVLKDKDCSAWILPVGGIDVISFTVGASVVPFLSSILKSAGYFYLEDRQAVPEDAFIYGIVYHGMQTHVTGSNIIISIDRWATYISDTGVPYALKRGSWDALGTEGAVPYSYAPPPVNGDNHPMTIANLYDWQFGIDWIFTNVLGQGPPGPVYPNQMSAVSTVSWPVISVPYVGGVEWPPEPEETPVYLSQLPIEVAIVERDSSGLYTPTPTGISTPRRDKFYGDISKKIPNPTVKTALIGE